MVLGLNTETAPGNLQGKSVRIKTLTLLIPAALLLGLPQPNTAVDPTGQSPRKEEEWTWKDKENMRYSICSLNLSCPNLCYVLLVLYLPLLL